MKIISFLLVLFGALNFATASGPRKVHAQCAAKVMDNCDCGDWACIDSTMIKRCSVPRRNATSQKRFIKLVRMSVRQAYCDPTPRPPRFPDYAWLLILTLPVDAKSGKKHAKM
jgi:hypothetical protein